MILQGKDGTLRITDHGNNATTHYLDVLFYDQQQIKTICHSLQPNYNFFQIHLTFFLECRQASTFSHIHIKKA